MTVIPIEFFGKIHSVKQRNPTEKVLSHTENTDFLIYKISVGVLDNFLSVAQKVSEKIPSAVYP